MSTRLSYRILNVFTIGDDPFSGNPLCVFEDAQGLSTEQMQNLARQLNLSETTFVTRADAEATAAVRIFTPDFEMPFAGHPTLGTAHVVRELFTAGDALVLRMRAGDIPVRADGNTWTLQANPPTTREVAISVENVTRTVGLPPSSLAAQPLWVNTGVEQLVVPLRSAEVVRAAQADPRLLREFIDLLPERLALNELSGDVRHVASLPDIVDGDDVGVVESGCGAGFLAEAENALGVLYELGGQQLQGDFAVEPRVLSEVDFAHAAASEEASEAVGTEDGTICGLKGHGFLILSHRLQQSSPG